MARTPLVLVPGLLNTGRVFAHQVAALADVADCFHPEPWHHDSIGAMADAALAVAPPTFALAGFSMGGYVAFEMLRRAPQRVERLALIDTQATPDAPESTARRQALLEQTNLGRFHGIQRSLLPQLLHRHHVNDPSIVEPMMAMAAEVGVEGFRREQKAIMARADSRPLLVRIDVPTVVIVGRQDQVTPLPRSEEIAADIATSRLAVIEECGHMSLLEKPAEVTAALGSWLNR